jgi:putative NADH-flavin reductase
MRIVIFGANGGTGRLLVAQALEAGHTTVGVTRRPDQFPFAHPALAVAGADVSDSAALGDIVAGADAVLSTLGVPFTREAVDTYSVGTANIVGAMRLTGVRRLVVVSSTALDHYQGRTDAVHAAARRTHCHQDDRQDRVRRHAADGGHRARQRFGLDDRAPVGPLRPAACHRLRCRTG